jgi:hypothetical protein
VRKLSSVRFFLSVRLHATYALVVYGIVSALGLLMIAAGPATGVDDAMGMLLFVQMFLCSSGFVERARRGHFDALLTASADRGQVAAAHWMVSSLPGALTWIAFVAMAAARGGRVPAAGGAALFIVSAVAWSAGFRLARGTAGFLWTAALFAVLLRNPRLVSDASPLAVVFCPFVLLKPTPNPVSSAIALGTCLTVLVVACRFGSRLDFFLLERQ